LPEEPRYWGSWKGRVIRAIAIDRAQTWSEMRDITGLSPKSLNRVLAEMFDAEVLENRTLNAVTSAQTSGTAIYSRWR